MATLVLAAAGSAIGSAFGGTFLGLTGAVIGRAVGATLGQMIDQRLMGGGSEVVEQGRVERLHLMSAGEGAAVPRVWGRMRVAGQVIWATRFVEKVRQRKVGGGGKGSQPSTTVKDYSYSVSLAMALCEGRVSRLGRIWADGAEINPNSIALRFYNGSETQLPDPKIAAVEGAGHAPAYRGTAYVVIEDLDLGRFGNRVPQFSFEVFRSAQGPLVAPQDTLAQAVRAVALVPGTGEYALATTPVNYDFGLGKTRSANRNTSSRGTDFSVAMQHLSEELPACESVSVVVCWFGDDLRADHCTIRPKVEQTEVDGRQMPWRAGGITRPNARRIARIGGRSIYGGTPADASVIEAIRALRARGKAVMFYPFVLMDQAAGNGRTDPWTGADDQPAFPWRGRITLSVAPGRAGSPDRTAAAAAEVAAFFGTATTAQVRLQGGSVVHQNVADWGYRRFILHYARLCQLAGGVDAFCVGSELRGITQIRGQGDSFPAVEALRALAADVRAILGPAVKVSYAADWSEYWGYVADGNRYFHLDPFWADPNVDFIGIDNYMPLSDWRRGQDHADAAWGSIYDLGYLKSNIYGGEGFDWFYENAEGAAEQRRIPIADEGYGEPWIWRYKDLKSWWGLAHHERIDGVRSAEPTGWVPMSKPFWFTEYGCAAVDRATNQPNLFIDPKSSESALPRSSTGARDDLIQMQYLRAIGEFFADPAENPVSPAYGGPMVDMSRAHVWAWDSRPFPHFPARTEIWSDGVNYARGHWLNGRATSLPLASVLAEIAGSAGLSDMGNDSLFGLVRGYELARVGTARSAIQPLQLAYGFDAVERDGKLQFISRTGVAGVTLDPSDFVADSGGDVSLLRMPDAEIPSEVRLTYIEAEGDYQPRLVSAHRADATLRSTSESELPLVLGGSEARGVAERWLAETDIARDAARFVLPPSFLNHGAGDVVRIGEKSYRIDTVEIGAGQRIEAVGIEAGTYTTPDLPELAGVLPPTVATGPVTGLFLELPLLTGTENPVAPHVAIAASAWPGPIAVWSSDGSDGYEAVLEVEGPAVIGRTEAPLAAARPGLWDRANVLRVRLSEPAVASLPELKVLNGSNLAAIGTGGTNLWEVIQFTSAEPVGDDVWELRGLLRGQAGTDGVMPEAWPAGADFVLLEDGLPQLPLLADEVGLVRRYRFGAALYGPDDADVTEAILAFSGIGQRPYAVSHLRATKESGGVRLRWIRRTRIGGDSWQGLEVPLSEAREAYVLRIKKDGMICREVELRGNEFLYDWSMQSADQVGSNWEAEVAQISDAFGAGPFRTVRVS